MLPHPEHMKLQKTIIIGLQFGQIMIGITDPMDLGLHVIIKVFPGIHLLRPLSAQDGTLRQAGVNPAYILGYNK